MKVIKLSVSTNKFQSYKHFSNINLLKNNKDEIKTIMNLLRKLTLIENLR